MRNSAHGHASSDLQEAILLGVEPPERFQSEPQLLDGQLLVFFFHTGSPFPARWARRRASTVKYTRVWGGRCSRTLEQPNVSLIEDSCKIQNVIIRARAEI